MTINCMDINYFISFGPAILVNMIPPPTTEPPGPRTTTSQTTTPTTTEPAITTETVTTTQANTAAPPTATTTAPLPPVTIAVAPITSSGSNTAGESYSLECTVTVTGSTDQPTITWMVNGDGSYSRTVTFNPLAASHAGTYTCRATLGSAMDTAVWNVIVQGE